MRRDTKNNTGVIYKIDNLVNRKIYIGKTTISIDLRWKQHIQASKRGNTNSLLHKAIKKYGENNFSITILFSGPIGVLNEKEIQYIDMYASVQNGYNLTNGGDGVTTSL